MMLEKLIKILKIKFQSSLRLKDGNTIIIDGSLSTDVKVDIVTPDGIVPLPSGSYELETGEIIEVTDGIIDKIIDNDTNSLDPTLSNEIPLEINVQSDTNIKPILQSKENETDKNDKEDLRVKSLLMEESIKVIELEEKIKELSSKIESLNTNNQRLEKLEKEFETILNKVTLAKEFKKSSNIKNDYSFEEISKILK
jgi:hypothetical protein